MAIGSIFLWQILFLVTLFAGSFLVWKMRRKIEHQTRLIQKIKTESNLGLLKIQSESIEGKRNYDFQKKVISILIHDLRSPLFFIQKVSKNLFETFETVTGEEMKAAFDALHKSTFNVSAFIADILYWMQISDGNFTARIRVFLFNEFIRPHCELYLAIANEKNLKIIFKSPDTFSIAADQNFLGIIIRNMLDNAIKNTDEGSITIDAFVQDTFQYIVISDTGSGMPLDKAFELEKGIITRKSPDSTQIGFRIVYDLVKKMAGTIKVSSSSLGTTITISLPMSLMHSVIVE